jgi:hypothetical protein
LHPRLKDPWKEMTVPRLIAALVLVAVSSGAAAQEAASTYWGLEAADESTWCGYANKAEFDAVASEDPPYRSANVTYSSRGELLEIVQQTQDGTGDWQVVDIYRPSTDGVRLERESSGYLDQSVWETTIRGSKAEPFRKISGSSEQAGPIPVPISTRLDDIPFKAVASEMRDGSIRKLCKRSGVTVPVPETYFLLRENNGNTWCAYTHRPEVPAAQVTYSSAAVQEIRITCLHGTAWEVFDRYEPSGSDWLLRRVTILNLRKQNRHLKVVRVTTIHKGKAEPFRVVSAFDNARPYADSTQQPNLSNVNLSPVPVSTNPSGETFMKVVSEMRREHLDELCRSTQ